MILHIDIETYSSVDIKTAGVYKYVESPDFEILLIAYAFNDGPINIVDLTRGEKIPLRFEAAMSDTIFEKHAHNATFERLAFKKYGLNVPVSRWRCSMVKAAYCGLPLGLGQVSEVLNLGDKGKLATGKALIKYFCMPCKPTKVNGGRLRNFPEHDPEKWESFKDYCTQDVEAERALGKKLSRYALPDSLLLDYTLDQEINDRGIEIDTDFAEKAIELDIKSAAELRSEMIELTGLDNPNSPVQLKEWLSEAMTKQINSLAKDIIPNLIEEAEGGAVKEVLRLRRKASKTSVKKYKAMTACAGEDLRARGLFQFYGANRTGRWAGRLIQLQNLPQNHLNDLEGAKEAIKMGDYELAKMLYSDVPSVLSQLIRTAFVAPKGKTFAVADFSAIEARVIAWLAGEEWRMEVFRSHGKIYEASAAKMFKVAIEEVTKDSKYRAKAKVAELALGYQGAAGALKKMGGEAMGLSDNEMTEIVSQWRASNPAIKALWKELEDCAKKTMATCQTVASKNKGLKFKYDGFSLTVELPSGRKLIYNNPSFTINKFGSKSIRYRGMDQTTKQWGWVDTYGGKLTENVVQAIARDILMYSMQALAFKGFDIVMHVHDEVVCEIINEDSEGQLGKICYLMGSPIPWAEGLPLKAEGYTTPFYKKD